MSAASTPFRKPTSGERALLRLLASRWSDQPPTWVDTILVQSMEDGKMGSLRLTAEPGAAKEAQVLGRKVAEHQFTDVDGVEVIASLNVDQRGRPFELDVWKTDFSPLVRFPEEAHNAV